MKEHIIINKDRTVVVPDSVRKIGIQYDHKVNTLTFDCPRYADDNQSIDLSRMAIYINFSRNDKTKGSIAATNVFVDPDDPEIMHFDFVITRSVTLVNGPIICLVCAKSTDAEGVEVNHWNSELFNKLSIGEGMEAEEELTEEEIDYITSLLQEINTTHAEVADIYTRVEDLEFNQEKQGVVSEVDLEAMTWTDGSYITGSGTIGSSSGYGISELVTLPKLSTLILDATGYQSDVAMIAKSDHTPLVTSVDGKTHYEYYTDEEIQVYISCKTTVAKSAKLVRNVGETLSDLERENSELKGDLGWKKETEIVPVFDKFKGFLMATNNGGYITPNKAPFDVSNPIIIEKHFKRVIGKGVISNPYTCSIGFFNNIECTGYAIQKIVTNGDFDVQIPDGAVCFCLGDNRGTNGTKHDATYYISGVSLSERVDDISERVSVLENKEISILKLPNKYELVVGDTFELFYKGVLLTTLSDNYYVKTVCDKGSCYTKRFIFKPSLSDIGTHILTLSVYDDKNNLIDTASVDLVVKAKATSPTTQKTVLNVGDSLLVSGEWAKELYRRLCGTGGNPEADNLSNIKFIGTCGTGNVKYEAYGGWTYRSYNNESKSTDFMKISCTGHDKNDGDQHSIYRDSNGTQWKLETISTDTIKIIRVSGSSSLPSTGILTWVSGGVNHSDISYTSSVQASRNPFWNDTTSQVDFANYANKLGVSSIDYVNVLLGWNSASESEASYKSEVQTFIDNIKDSFPNAKITLIGLQIPARDGLGVNYGSNGIYSDYLGLINYVHNVDKWNSDLAYTNTNVTSINLSGQFDTENNMQSSTRTVNVRNDKTEIYQVNGVHPAIQGYYQISDAVYRNFTHKLQ